MKRTTPLQKYAAQFRYEHNNMNDRRIWKIAEAIRRGMPQSMLHDITQIDIWFIDKIAILVGMENALKNRKLTKELLLEATDLTFVD